MIEEPKPGIYRHYKGKEYQVIGVAILSGTEEDSTPTKSVVYIPLYGDRGLRYRPLEEFCEEVDVSEYGYRGPRFKFIRET